MSPLSAGPGGVHLRVRVQPRASRTEVAGLFGNALRIRLQAPPVDGAANEALVRFVAEALEVPRSAVAIVSGLSSRSKTLAIGGLTPAEAGRRLGLD